MGSIGNTIEDAIIKLWKEARNPRYIAQKLGLVDETGQPDTEKVEMVIDDQHAYGGVKSG
jgi:hypothetical protein